SGDLDRAPVESHLVFELALLRLDADLVREDRERRIVLADLEDLEHLAVGVARADALPDGDLGELIAVEIAELEAGDHAGAAHAEIQKAELLATAVLGPADGEELPEHGHPPAAGAARDVAVRLARRDVRETVVAEEPFERLLTFEQQRAETLTLASGARRNDRGDLAGCIAVRVRHCRTQADARRLRFGEGGPRDLRLEQQALIRRVLDGLGAR